MTESAPLTHLASTQHTPCEQQPATYLPTSNIRSRRESGKCAIFTIATLTLAASLLSACVPTRPTAMRPPVLTSDEIIKPYVKLGIINVSRERLGSPEDLQNIGNDWAYEALSSEAAKLGADAVIFPEIRVERNLDVLLPSSEIKAKGTAIKFR